jgi:uncharacterized protein (TIGR03435 family)
VTLRQLIRNAYQLQDFQISGGPNWLASDRFDIVAKAEGRDLGDPFQAEKSGAPSRGQLMLRALLADRFKLEVHAGTKELPIYALTATRRDGRFGPQLQPSSLDCDGSETDSRGRAAAKLKLPANAPERLKPLRSDAPCGMRIMPGKITAGGATMAQLANALSALVGRVVRDRTGLADDFEFTLRWTPDQIPRGYDKKANAMGLPKIDADGPSLFTAMREQLGLKLDSSRGPVDVLVIDHAEKPNEN